MNEKQIEETRERILKQIESLPEEQAEGLKEKIESMNAEEFEGFLKQNAVPLEECLFCQIINGKIKTVRIYESKNILAILDINPASSGHMLVMPKQHYQFLTQLPDELLFEIMAFVKHIIPSIIRTVKSKGVAINILQGREQIVPHFAINIIPRFDNDKFNFSLKRQKLSMEDLEKIAELIRKDAGEAAKQTAATKTNEKEEASEEETEKEVKTEEQEDKAENIEVSDEEFDRFFKRRIP